MKEIETMIRFEVRLLEIRNEKFLFGSDNYAECEAYIRQAGIGSFSIVKIFENKEQNNDIKE